MNYKYEDIIKLINSHQVLEIRFQIKEYAHYKNCKIIIKKEILKNYNNIFLIDIELTRDSEHICFYDKFKEDYKLFYMGKKGSYTLKQIWDRVEITELIKGELI